MKKAYEQMKVIFVGRLKKTLEKSGAFTDSSGQHDDKTWDAGGGNGGLN